MNKVKIFKKDGTPTPYFWMHKPTGEGINKTVYKQTADGVKRMKGVRFNATTKRMLKD
jgi:hypothetical protein